MQPKTINRPPINLGLAIARICKQQHLPWVGLLPLHGTDSRIGVALLSLYFFSDSTMENMTSRFFRVSSNPVDSVNDLAIFSGEAPFSHLTTMS